MIPNPTPRRTFSRVAIFAGASALAALHSQPGQAQSMDYGALQQLFGEPVTTSATGSPQRATEVPADMKAQGWEQTGPRQMKINYMPSKGAIGEILATAQAHDFAIIDLSTEETDLEDIFLQLTGRRTATA